MKTEVKAEIRDISPKEAKQLLICNVLNRPISPNNVAYLVSQMDNGNWIFNGDPIRFADYNKEGKKIDRILLDGQHRLKSIILADKTKRCLIVTGLTSDAFLTIDTGKKRSPRDVLYIEGYQSNAALLAPIISFIMKYNNGGFKGKSSLKRDAFLTNKKVVDFMKANEQRLLNTAEYTKEVTKNFNLLVKRVVGGMYYIFIDINADQADNFFKKLTTGEGIKVGEPIYQLRDILIKNYGSQQKFPQWYLVAILIKAWNYYRKDGKVNKLRFQIEKENFPIPI